MKYLTGILVITLLLAACGDSAVEPTSATRSTAAPPSDAPVVAVTVNGVGIDEPGAILALGEQRLVRDDHEAARCYFSSFSDTNEIAPILRCGPARGANSSNLGPWLTVGLVATMEEPLTLGIDADFGRGWDLLAGERLFRPDGLAPPPEGNTSLPPPTAFDRSANPIVRELPVDFQQCMHNRGWLVFRTEFLYDGGAQPQMFDDLANLEYVGHEPLSFGTIDEAANGAIATACVAEVADEWDLTVVAE